MINVYFLRKKKEDTRAKFKNQKIVQNNKMKNSISKQMIISKIDFVNFQNNNSRNFKSKFIKIVRKRNLNRKITNFLNSGIRKFKIII